MKKCARCGLDKAMVFFYHDRNGKPSARCRQCHGVEFRACKVCRRVFEAKQGRLLCSEECRQKWRPRTRVKCLQCGCEFPVSHLNQKFCSKACGYLAKCTGRQTFRKTIQKARNAQHLIRYHIQTGNITRPACCEECGAERRIEAAHYNYDEPLRVRWLCRSCHVRWDKREPKGATFVVQRTQKNVTFTGRQAERVSGTVAVEAATP